MATHSSILARIIPKTEGARWAIVNRVAKSWIHGTYQYSCYPQAQRLKRISCLQVHSVDGIQQGELISAMHVVEGGSKPEDWNNWMLSHSEVWRGILGELSRLGFGTAEAPQASPSMPVCPSHRGASGQLHFLHICQLHGSKGTESKRTSQPGARELFILTQSWKTLRVSSTAFYQNPVTKAGLFRVEGNQIPLLVRGMSKNLWTCFKITTIYR